LTNATSRRERKAKEMKKKNKTKQVASTNDVTAPLFTSLSVETNKAMEGSRRID
jgi:hypothetical protein